MYLSKVAFRNTPQASCQLAKLLKNGAYTSHQLIWQLFPKQPDKKRDYLFREERVGGGIGFYLLSSEPPSSEQTLFDVQTKPFNPVLSQGMQLGFRLMANPTISKKLNPDDKRSKRFDVMMHAKKQLQQQGETDKNRIKQGMIAAAQNWLMGEKRQFDYGFRLNAVPDIVGSEQHQTIKKGVKGTIQFTSVDYQGVLTVTDPDKFKATLYGGIGRSKAFGCGLMLIRQV